MSLDLDLVLLNGKLTEQPKELRRVIADPERIFFNTHEPRFFEELYSLCTGDFTYKVTENAQKSPLTVSICIEDTESKTSKFGSKNSQFRMDA